MIKTNDDLAPNLSQGELAILLGLSERLVCELGLDSILKLVADTAGEVMQAETIVVPMIDVSRLTFTYQAASGIDADLLCGQTFPIDEGACGWVLKHQRPLLFGDSNSDDLNAEARWEPGMTSSLLVPLMCRGRIMGGLSALGKRGGGPYTMRDLSVLTLFANQASIAIDNARLFQALREDVALARLALDSVDEAIYGIDTEGRCTFVNPACLHRLGFQFEAELVGRDVHSTIHHSHGDGSPYPISECPVHRSMREGHDRHAGEGCYWRSDGTSFPVEYRSHPMFKDGRVIGAVVTFLDITQRKIAEQLGQLRQQLADMVYTHEQQQLLQTTLSTAEQLTGSQISFFHFVEKDQETVSLQTWSIRTLEKMCYAKGDSLHYPISEAGVWVDCIHQRKPVIHNDYPSLPHKKGLPEGHPPIVRELTIPVFRDKYIVAVLGVGNKPDSYTDHDVSLVSQLADMTYDFVERRQAEQQIQFMAFNDMLTGLPNRRLFADRLQQAVALARRSNKLLAIGYLDLDGFKSVNDRLGHQAGDQLLVQMAKRLQQELRECDTLARLGGDEFVILLSELGSVFTGEKIVERILQVIAQPFEIDGHLAQLSASMGMTFFPQDDNDPDTLIRHADQAMYKAKENGKNTCRLYNPIEDRKTLTFRKRIAELEEALHQSQLILYYQPRIDLRSGELAGVEALVRWQHPEKGLTYPRDFLPMIGDRPLGVALDEWVLQAALEQHLHWRTQGLTLPVSVNISPQHIQQAAFPAFLGKLLSNYPEGTSRYLELEILEPSATSDIAHVAEIMNACTKLGVTFSLDDFGTGYSSLTYFHRLPISILKIDQHFVRDMLSDPRDQDIVEGVVRLADALDRPVVAEGVESIELGLMLADLGYRYAQGYGIARPMPADAVPTWSEQWKSEDAWHRLPQEVHGPTTRYDLNVAIFIHIHWANKVKTYLASGLVAQRPILDAAACQFSRWYKGIGAARYGKRPSYPFLLAKHNEAHRLAQEIVKTAEDQSVEAALSRLDELAALCEELVASLKRLSAE